MFCRISSTIDDTDNTIEANSLEIHEYASQLS